MSSLRVHPKYGVNPSLVQCVWCGEHSGVALLGYNHDKEAPREVFLNYDPCYKCEALMKQGITFMEVFPRPLQPGHPAIAKDLYPSGRWLVVKREALKKIMEEGTNMYDTVMLQGKAYIETDLFDALAGTRATDGLRDAVPQGNA